MKHPDIYSYVEQEEARFENEKITVADNWEWNFRDHVQIIFHLKNGVFFTGPNNWLRAFKNIMEPILNLVYWTEDIEVKDVMFFTEEMDDRGPSFLIKKYHDEVFVRKYNLDTLFDEIAESDIDYGGVVVQKTDGPRPEVLPLKDIAFCDQTDLLGGPLAFKHDFAPDKLRSMEKIGWGDPKNGATISLDDLIALADNSKTPPGLQGTKNATPGPNIAVYIVRGTLPNHYLYDDNDMESYTPQLHVIAFYNGKDSNRRGVTLYRKEDDGESLKFFTSKKVEGRALGRGVGEGLLHPQVWTNFLTIHKMNLLEAASKVPLYTDDATYTQKNKIQNMENLEVTVIEEGHSIHQVPTAAPANIQLIEKSIDNWYEQGQLQGSAFDPLLGKQAVSGTTFRGQTQVIQQGRGIHDRRRGQRAKFIEEIYRDWILPYIIREIKKGTKFLASLSVDEMQWVFERVADTEASKRVKEMVLSGHFPTQDEKDAIKQIVKDTLAKKGNSHMLEITKGEFDDIEIRIGINIAGKQKDMAGLSDKILSFFQLVFANPVGFLQTMKIPGMSKAVQDILEYGGLNPVDFASLATMPVPEMTPQTPGQNLQVQQQQTAQATAP